MPVEPVFFREGKTIFQSYPPEKADKGFVPTNLRVFYNPNMVSNRDLSIMVCASLRRKLGRPISALEPLSGCGVRGIRLGNELKDYFQSILLNDINPAAYSLIQSNIQINRLRSIAYAFNDDANSIMRLFSYRDWRVDYIDIDPFGSPAPYINSAISVAKIGSSILAFTATDMSVLCGLYPAKAFSKYGGVSLRTDDSHETALRMLLYNISLVAGGCELSVKPLISYYADHYVRVYLSVVKGPLDIKSKTGYIEYCLKCLYKSLIPVIENFNRNCPLCGARLAYSGPVWTGQICDEEFVKDVLTMEGLNYLPSFNRVRNILATLIMENNMPPYHYDVHVLCDLMQVKIPKLNALLKNLSDNGYRATGTHFTKIGIKTDAPINIIKKFLSSSPPES
ncbi:MAG: tRNA (guanine(10)-N(2))-dimethyltransferase [Candidatus Odinarchaeota archaeon]